MHARYNAIDIEAREPMDWKDFKGNDEEERDGKVELEAILDIR